MWAKVLLCVDLYMKKLQDFCVGVGVVCSRALFRGWYFVLSKRQFFVCLLMKTIFRLLCSQLQKWTFQVSAQEKCYNASLQSWTRNSNRCNFEHNSKMVFSLSNAQWLALFHKSARNQLKKQIRIKRHMTVARADVYLTQNSWDARSCTVHGMASQTARWLYFCDILCYKRCTDNFWWRNVKAFLHASFCICLDLDLFEVVEVL